MSPHELTDVEMEEIAFISLFTPMGIPDTALYLYDVPPNTLVYSRQYEQIVRWLRRVQESL